MLWLVPSTYHQHVQVQGRHLTKEGRCHEQESMQFGFLHQCIANQGDTAFVLVDLKEALCRLHPTNGSKHGLLSGCKGCVKLCHEGPMIEVC